MLDPEQIESYRRDGWLTVKSLFSPDEVRDLRDHYMTMRESGSWPGDSSGVEHSSTDPLKRYPRMIHMHRWDEISLRWILDPRIDGCLTDMLGESPFAVQTMLYFKPAGARGQALRFAG